MPKLSESEIPAMLNIMFKVMDYTSFFWNVYMVLTGLVVGWIFAGKESWGAKQKIVVTVLYCLAIGVNSVAIYRIYGWLKATITDLKEAAQTLDEASTPHIKEILQKSPGFFILGGKPLVVLVDLIVIPVMIFCIWGLK